MPGTNVILNNGSVSSPSLSFNSDSKLGLYYLGTDQMGFAVGSNTLGVEMGNFSVTNIIPNPPGSNTVRYTMGVFAQPLGTDAESSAIYMKMNHATSQMVYGIYGEIDANQNGVGGSFTKVNHLGAGDAHYVAHFGTGGIGYESASWANNTTGFLADVQIAGLSNAIMFNALWAQATVPNYGMFVATGVPANALTISKFDDAHEGNVQIRITEPNYGYDRFEVFNNGQINQIALNSSSTTTLTNAPEHRLIASYWNGTASVQQHAVIGQMMESNAPASAFYFKVGPYGSEQYCCLMSPGLLDLQNGSLVNVNTIQGNTTNLDVYVNAQPIAIFGWNAPSSVGTVAFNVETATAATAGTATLPSNPLGFMYMTLNGTAVKVPYYSV